MNNIQSGIVKAFRSSGKALDAFGKNFEVNPHVDKRKYLNNLIFK
jgi:hypothetical protein